MSDGPVLNEEQRGVLADEHSPLIVQACPGSGKTTTMIALAKQWLRRGVDPERILLTTFTRKAAGEIRVRLGNPFVAVGTFHSICYAMIRDNWQALGYCDSRLVVVDPRERKDVVRWLISITRDARLTMVLAALDESRDRKKPLTAAEVRGVLAYKEFLRKENAVDYALIISEAMELLRQGLGARWSHVIVDEFQDIDGKQGELCRLLKADHLVCVGDVDQTIYSWRGADPTIAQRWKEEGAEIRGLSVNHRSQDAIIAAAEWMRGTFKVKSVRGAMTGLQEGGKVEVLPDTDAAAVLGAFKSTAVLCRTNRVCGNVSALLHAQGVEHTLVGRKERALERPDVKTAIAYAVWPDVPRSTIIGERILRAEGWTPIQIQKLRAEASRTAKPAFDIAVRMGLDIPWGGVTDVIERTALAVGRTMTTIPTADQEAMDVLVEAAVEFGESGGSVAEFLYWLSSRDAQDDVKDGGGIQVMTVHAAKGLEFDAVAIFGLERGVVPWPTSDIEEERRLMYVAMTRARHHLILVDPGPHQRSEFLEAFIAQAGQASHGLGAH